MRALSRETSCALWGTTSCAIWGSRSSLSSEALLRSFITAPSTHICLRLFTKEWITTQKNVSINCHQTKHHHKKQHHTVRILIQGIFLIAKIPKLFDNEVLCDNIYLHGNLLNVKILGTSREGQHRN